MDGLLIISSVASLVFEGGLVLTEEGGVLERVLKSGKLLLNKVAKGGPDPFEPLLATPLLILIVSPTDLDPHCEEGILECL